MALTAREWRIIVVLMNATLCSSFAVCLFPPFFPRLAEEKGASAAIYGFIIGTNCLTSFLVTPLIGKNLTKWGVRFSLSIGMLLGGLCCTLSGFLEFFPAGYKFVLTAVAIRAIHATGNALVITSTFTYSAVEFQENVGQIFSFTRTAMNLAQLLGPTVGGALYQAGGFHLPFITMGAGQAFMGIVSMVFLPSLSVPDKEQKPEEEGEEQSRENQEASEAAPKQPPKKKISILKVLAIPTIWFSFVTFICATICNGFLSINLEPKVLRKFDLSPVYVGLLFGIKDGANSIASPVWGYICDKCKKKSVKPLMILSALLVAASFIFMGAGSIMKMEIDLSLPFLIFALCLNGVGIGGEQVSGVVDALHEAIDAGYPDDPVMHGLVAGLWSSLSGAGRFVSRWGSGGLVDWIGFNATAAIVTSLQVAIAVLTLVYMIFCECTLKPQKAVKWDDITIIEDQEESTDELVFTETVSPSESLMGKTVSIDMPRPRTASNARRRISSVPAGSLPPPILSSSGLASTSLRNSIQNAMARSLHASTINEND